jgi:DNA-binding NarL/FixJ family response regulator
MPRGTVYLTKREITDVEVLKASISQAIRASTDPGQTIARVTLNEPLSSLTDNQIELLRLMAKGLSNAEIAKQRFVNEKSVETSITRLAKTLRVERTQSQNQRVHMAKTYFRALGMNLADEG